MTRFNTNLVHAACAEGDPEAIISLAEYIRGNLERRAELKRTKPEKSSVRVLGMISDSEAGNFAYRMVRACERRQQPPPKALGDLFQKLLGQDRPHGKMPHSSKHQLAREFVQAHPTASVRRIARECGAAHSTVSGWKKDGIIP